MKNPGIDTTTWERLKKRWSELQVAGYQLKISFRLLVDAKDEEYVLAIDVNQHINDEVITETVSLPCFSGHN